MAWSATPSATSARAWSTSTWWRRGRPSRRPCAFARRSPATTRSRMRSRSNSAIAASTWNSRRPLGVVVSIAWSSTTRSTPRASKSPAGVTRCRVERARRSRRTHTTRSTWRARTASSTVHQIRLRGAPRALSREIVPMGENPPVAGWSLSSSVSLPRGGEGADLVVRAVAAGVGRGRGLVLARPDTRGHALHRGHRLLGIRRRGHVAPDHA